MTKHSLFLTAAAAALLTGCSTLIPDGTSADIAGTLRGKTALYSWSAKGHTIFSCDYDKVGFYWRFLRAEGVLLDNNGRQTASFGRDWIIRGRDGSVLKTAILYVDSVDRPENLRNALFKTHSPSSHGLFAQVTYVERRNAKGGMPLTRCSASQRGKILRVPFDARYIFWH